MSFGRALVDAIDRLPNGVMVVTEQAIPGTPYVIRSLASRVKYAVPGTPVPGTPRKHAERRLKPRDGMPPFRKTARQKRVLQRQIEAADRDLDRLVYELCGLTGEEIAIVQEAP